MATRPVVERNLLASLRVCDLHPDVTESMLYEKFISVGPVISILICRDAITRRSLGYGYVNFQQPADAERAIATMNFDQMNNKPIRIMWAPRDSAVRRSNNANIFIKNLDQSIDSDELRRSFEPYGKIDSAKVMTDENGCSKGFGFVGYENAEDAARAMADMNQKMVKGKPLYIALAQRKEERRAQLGQQYMQRAAMRQNQVGGMPSYNTGIGNAGINMPGHPVQPQQNYMGRPPMMPPYYQIPQNPHMGQRPPPDFNYGFGRGSEANCIVPNSGRPRRSPFNRSKVPLHDENSLRVVSIQQNEIGAKMSGPSDPREQKQEIGEQLYKLITNMTNDPNVGKITGMLLEMDNKDLLTLLGDKELLLDRVRQANVVLQQAIAKEI